MYAIANDKANNKQICYYYLFFLRTVFTFFYKLNKEMGGYKNN